MAGNKHVVLMVPIGEKTMRSKAYHKLATEVHAVLFDLEDAVPDGEKARARQLLPDVVKNFASLNPNLYVRVNNSELLEAELEAVDSSPATGILMPKVTSKADIERLEALIKTRMKNHHYKMEIHPIIETPAAVMRCHEILSASPWVKQVFFGCEDLSDGLGLLEPNPLNMAYAAQKVVLEASVLGLGVYGAVGVFSSFELKYKNAFLEVTRASRNFGFAGGVAIHPCQVRWIKEAYALSASEKELMKEVIALGEGKGVFSVGGRMYGPPMRKRFRSMLEGEA